MEAEELREAFCEEWSSVIADTAWRDELIRSCCSRAATDNRATCQREIAGVKVQPIVDLLDTKGRVLDFKTAPKRPNGVAAEHSLQLTHGGDRRSSPR